MLMRYRGLNYNRERDGEPSLFCFALSQKRERSFAWRLCVRQAKEPQERNDAPARPLAAHSDSTGGRVGTSDATRHSGAETSARIPRISMQKNHFAISQSRASRALCARARRIAKRSSGFISQCGWDPPTLSMHESCGVIMGGWGPSPSGTRVRDIAGRPFF